MAFTDNWTESQWKRHKAWLLALELYCLEKHGHREWYKLPKDTGMNLTAHITFLGDKVIDYVAAAGYVWNGKEWTATDTDTPSTGSGATLDTDTDTDTLSTDTDTLSTDTGVDYQARLYHHYKGRTYRVKVFDDTLTIERQSPKHESSIVYSRRDHDVYDGWKWNHTAVNALIEVYEKQNSDNVR